MGMLTREAIRAVADELRRERVRVPEWGGDVYVRTLTMPETMELLRQLQDAGQEDFGAQQMVAVIVATVCDAEGKLLFTADDVPWLRERSFRPLQRVFRVASRLNPLTDQELDNLGKDSGGSPDSSSPTASPATSG